MKKRKKVPTREHECPRADGNVFSCEAAHRNESLGWFLDEGDVRRDPRASLLGTPEPSSHTHASAADCIATLTSRPITPSCGLLFVPRKMQPPAGTRCPWWLRFEMSEDPVRATAPRLRPPTQTHTHTYTHKQTNAQQFSPLAVQQHANHSNHANFYSHSYSHS